MLWACTPDYRKERCRQRTYPGGLLAHYRSGDSVAILTISVITGSPLAGMA
jgi:hypothetical protein